jgi:hypothetical protein
VVTLPPKLGEQRIERRVLHQVGDGRLCLSGQTKIGAGWMLWFFTIVTLAWWLLS